jgi:hypothetical protein
MATNPEFPPIAWAGPASSGRSRAGLGPMRYITWHCTGNPNSDAYGEAAFARNRTDGVGTHVAADATVCLQTQVTTLTVGHVGSGTGNRYGIAIECCGVNDNGAAHWRPIIDRCVPFVRLAMAKHGIANRWLTIAEMRDGHSTGHITHDMARIAWGGTDHTDPGPNFPKDYVLAAVNAASNPGGDMELSDQIPDLGGLTVGVFMRDLWTHTVVERGLTLDANGIPQRHSADRWTGPHLLTSQTVNARALAAKVDLLTTVVQALAEAVNEADGNIDTAAIFTKIDAAVADLKAEVRDTAGDLGEGGAEKVRADEDNN